MSRPVLMLGLVALVVLVIGMLSGIILGSMVMGPPSSVHALKESSEYAAGFSILCGKEVYRNETLKDVPMKGLIVKLESDKIIVTEGEPRIVVYKVEGLLCGHRRDGPEWSVRDRDGVLWVEVDKGILEIYVPLDSLESLSIEAYSGSASIYLNGSRSLRESKVYVGSGIVDMTLAGLQNLRNYTIILDSGAATINLDYNGESGGDVYVQLSSGRLNLDMSGEINACLSSSNVSSGSASISLPVECGSGFVKVHVEVSDGSAVIVGG